jgi:hypothetical protein
MLRAHRAVWEQYVGPIPEGKDLHHKCGLKHCVNPDHLEPVTSQRNKQYWADELRTCPSGHLKTSENTHVDKQGKRHCRVCDRERKKR